MIVSYTLATPALAARIYAVTAEVGPLQRVVRIDEGELTPDVRRKIGACAVDPATGLVVVVTVPAAVKRFLFPSEPVADIGAISAPLTPETLLARVVAVCLQSARANP